MTQPTAPGILDLAGLWNLHDPETGANYPMSLPGDGLSALVAAGALPDPYWRCNEYEARRVSAQDWLLRREFDLEETAMDLVVSDLDTVAEIRVNGTTVLAAKNGFRRYRADASTALVAGRNSIEILFRSAPKVAAALQADQPFFVPWSKNCPIPNGNMLRKPACDFGWDWNIAVAPFGLYGDIRLEPQSPVQIEGISVDQHHSEGNVTLTLAAHVTGEAAEVVFVFDADMQVAPVKDGVARTAFTLRKPQLWWPVGMGAQPLYDLTVSCGRVSQDHRIGLARIEQINEDGGFRFRVNGRDLFAKGANWIPADALPGRITRDKTRDLLQSAVDANMNMIRIWGGGRYEPDWFYDLCDEMGLLVWQDFMFACNLYPSTPDFLAEVSAEVRDVCLRLNTHPCIALWCGDNELIGALTWFDESRRDRDRYLVSYDRLNRTIETALKDLLPNANWWPSSPASGLMNFGDAWHDDSAGDMHFWSVWHEGRDFDHYRDVAPRFCSEFGFQSFPSMDVIRQFADPVDFNISAPVMDSHQKDPGGNARITETMFRYFRFPNGFEDFTYLSQVQQALAIKTAISHWRGLKPHCMGTLYWQLNDTWPVASWSSLDYGGGWKLLHYLTRRFYAPLVISVVPTKAGWTLRGVNDGTEGEPVRVEAFGVTTKGAARSLLKTSGTIPTDCALDLAEIPRDDLRPDEVIQVVWQDRFGVQGDDHFAPLPYKSYQLQPPAIRLVAKRLEDVWHLDLTASALALYVAIETSAKGRLSDNAILLRPGQPRRITFTPDDPKAEVAFATRDLYSATCPAIAQP